MDDIVVYLNGSRGAAVARRISDNGHAISALILPLAKAPAPFVDELKTICSAEIIPAGNVNEPAFVDRIRKLGPRLGIIAGYSTIFKDMLLNIPEFGTLNLHGGALPGYRGGSPLNWQIINGESHAEINIIQTDDGIDTGDVLASERIEIGNLDTIASIHDKANDLFPRMVVNAIEAIEDGTLSPRPQDVDTARYWHQRNDVDGRIHWDRMTAREIFNLVRGISHPYPGAHCLAQNRELRIFACEIPDLPVCGVPGRVLWLEGKGPFVVCQDQAVRLTEYTIDGSSAERLENGSQLG
jgi:methionyl-tRNA formyltransferase